MSRLPSGNTGIDIPMRNGWGFLADPADDLMWIYIYRDVGAGQVIFSVNVCAVLPEGCSDGRPAWELQRDDESFAVVRAGDLGDPIIMWACDDVDVATMSDYPGGGE